MTLSKQGQERMSLGPAGIGYGLLVAGVAALACGSSDGSSFSDGPSTSTDPIASDPRFGTSTTGPVVAGGAEVCDGIDNDGDGIVDNVDEGHDGICDCIRIATLGSKGVWGDGDVFATWLDGKSTKGATDLADQVLTPMLLAPYQVIVAQDLSKIGRTYSDAEIGALADWVKAGGGLLTLTGFGEPTELTNVNALLATFGLAYDATPILQKGGDTVPVTGWVPHAVTDGVTRLGVDNGYEVRGSGVTLATEQGFALLKAQEVERGHVLAWGDEWITYNSEWSGHPDYQIARFWVNAIKWLTPANVCQVPVPSSIR
jgi:hypothetical protein